MKTSSILLTLLLAAGVSERALAADHLDAKFGGVGGTRFQAELGWSEIPRLSLLTAVGNSFELGGAFAFDLGHYSTVVVPQLHFTGPMRIALARKGKLTMGLLLEPGFGLAFAEGAVGFEIILHSGLNIGAEVSPEFTVGGGFELPMLLVIGGGGFGMNMPLLFGPVLEIHPTPELGIIFDAKFGPNIGFGSGPRGDAAGVGFGLKIGLGVAYRF